MKGSFVRGQTGMPFSSKSAGSSLVFLLLIGMQTLENLKESLRMAIKSVNTGFRDFASATSLSVSGLSVFLTAVSGCADLKSSSKKETNLGIPSPLVRIPNLRA